MMLRKHSLNGSYTKGDYTYERNVKQPISPSSSLPDVQHRDRAKILIVTGTALTEKRPVSSDYGVTVRARLSEISAAQLLGPEDK